MSRRNAQIMEDALSLPATERIGLVESLLASLDTVARQAIDVWSSLGGELKPSLDLVVTVPLFEGTSKDVGPPVFEDPRFSFDDGERSELVTGRGGRRSRDAAPSNGIPPEIVYGGVAQRTRSGKSKAKKRGSAGDGRGGRVFAVGSPPGPGRRISPGADVDDD